MTEFRDLLQRAAPEPRRNVDVADLDRRAGRQRARARAVGGLSAVLVAATVLAVGLTSLSGPDDGQAEVAARDTAETVSPGGDPAGGETDAVSEGEARAAFAEMVRLAAERTPEAMERLCSLSRLNGCHGMSGGIVRFPESAPGGGLPAPVVLCSRAVSQGAWMLVVEGEDGYGRPYVSQMVFDRDDDGAVVPLHEAGFWLGIAYNGTKVTGSTTLTAAYSAQEGVDPPERTEEVTQQARAACESVVDGPSPRAGFVVWPNEASTADRSTPQSTVRAFIMAVTGVEPVDVAPDPEAPADGPTWVDADLGTPVVRVLVAPLADGWAVLQVGNGGASTSGDPPVLRLPDVPGAATVEVRIDTVEGVTTVEKPWPEARQDGVELPDGQLRSTVATYRDDNGNVMDVVGGHH